MGSFHLKEERSGLIVKRFAVEMMMNSEMCMCYMCMFSCTHLSGRHDSDSARVSR